jgi:hypothetical protein
VKKGIALLITLLFIISITFAIGLGLKYINQASSATKKESFMIQTSLIVNDVLKLLKGIKEIDLIIKEKSPDMLSMFLAQSAFIPFESSGIKMIIELNSARAKFNPNTLVDKNGTINGDIEEALKIYLSEKSINESYTDMLIDMMSKVKQDMSYNTDIFNTKPYLFRDYIVSHKHLLEINQFYLQTFRENSINLIDFEKIFYFSPDRDYRIDLNYLTPEMWHFLLGSEKVRAEQLSSGSGSYTKLKDLDLDDGEKQQLAKFKTSYFQPIIDVRVEIMQNDMDAKIYFEYDMQTKKGSNFYYEI